MFLVSGKIKPTLISRNISKIGHPYLAGGRGLELLSQEIVGYCKTMFGVCSDSKPAILYTAQDQFPTNTLYPMQPDIYPVIG
jgi:hypothetical protein